MDLEGLTSKQGGLKFDCEPFEAQIANLLVPIKSSVAEIDREHYIFCKLDDFSIEDLSCFRCEQTRRNITQSDLAVLDVVPHYSHHFEKGKMVASVRVNYSIFPS